MFLPDTNPRNSVAPRTSGPRAKNRTSHAMGLERGHIKLKTLPWAEARFTGGSDRPETMCVLGGVDFVSVSKHYKTNGVALYIHRDCQEKENL